MSADDADPDAPGGTGPATVAVMGSCVTRDCFNSRLNPTYKRWYTCPVHQNQSSLIALMSEPVEVSWTPLGEMGPYNRRNIQVDLSRSFLTEVVALQPDYLIVDFFGDVHFGCLQLDSGPYLTNNRWNIQHTDFYRDMTAAGRFRVYSLLEDPDVYLELWREAFDRFAEFVRTRLPQTRLIVHRGHNTDLLRLPDRSRPASLQARTKVVRLDVARANRLWSELDDYAVRASGAEEIDLTDVAWGTSREHPWGAFYVHFDLEYYPRFLAELHKIHLRTSGRDDVLAMAEEIDRARAGEAAMRLGAAEQIITQQRRRLRRRAAGSAPESGLVARVRRRLGRLRRVRSTTGQE